LVATSDAVSVTDVDRGPHHVGLVAGSWFRLGVMGAAGGARKFWIGSDR
jgi:hypothetical protein